VIHGTLRLLTLLFALLMATAAAQAQNEYFVTPSSTDAAISGWNDPHVVEIDRSAAQNRILFVHLVGSFGTPDSSKLILRQAARGGDRAIGLTYPNSWTVDSLCDSSSDPDCYEKVRLEIIDGGDRTSLVSVTRADSIENRLTKLLLYLDQRFPNDGWRTFLDGAGEPLWERITISGHSQGGGEAAMIGAIHRVNRVVMFASPKDFSSFFNAPAAWLSGPHATPIEAYYGFCHTLDGPQQLQIWTALRLNVTGPSAIIDGQSPPSGGLHMLFTRATPAPSGQYHGCVVVDRDTPLQPDGTPLFADVWKYMFGPPPVGKRRAVQK
jgi:hypothetical protein